MTEDLIMMKDPKHWPMWPVLPVKKPKDVGWPEMGILINGKGPVVFKIGLFEISENTDFNKVEKKEYPSFEAIVEDGWIVD